LPQKAALSLQCNIKLISKSCQQTRYAARLCPCMRALRCSRCPDHPRVRRPHHAPQRTARPLSHRRVLASSTARAQTHASSQASAALSPPPPLQLSPISPSCPPPPVPLASMAPPTASTSPPPQRAPASGLSALRAAAGATTKFLVSLVQTPALDRRVFGRPHQAAHA
jgi:hypothetical protein